MLTQTFRVFIESIFVVGFLLAAGLGPLCAQENSPFFQRAADTNGPPPVVTGPGPNGSNSVVTTGISGPANDPQGTNGTVRERLPQTKEGEKPAAKASGGRFFAALMKIFFSLALVLALFFALAWFLKKFSPHSTSALPRELLSIVGQTTLTSRHRLFLVRFSTKLVLLAVSADQVEVLSEITDSQEVASILSQLGVDGKVRTTAATRGEGLLSQLLTGKEPRA
ncbi:MAG: flagellar biosynthetic protein FliO [Planctomycetia bacterium]|nr:flagellar biosynthetic protein FliO [Planctomycetia bacterium]